MTIIYLLLIALSCVIIWRASDGFEVASAYIGRNLNDGVRGATINAIGSSMPELFTTMWFLFVLHNRDGFAGGIGTTAGSAIFNGMIIPAVVILAVIGFGMAKKVEISKKVIWRDGLSLIIVEAILIFLIGDKLEWWHGLTLIAMYLVYVVIMMSSMTKHDKFEDFEKEEDREVKPLFKSLLILDLESVFIRREIKTVNAWGLLLVSMFIIGASCALLVYACEGTAHSFGVKIYFVAVILASAATSVPDTILSYRDAMAGEYDDAVANALGSNIFDVCFALGFPLFVYTLLYGPITMSPETVDNVTELRILLLLSTILAFLIYVIGKGMGKVKAVLLLGIYVAFTVFIACQAYEVQWALDFGDFLRGLMP